MIDHLDRNRDRVYEHDALGRLIKEKSGSGLRSCGSFLVLLLHLILHVGEFAVGGKFELDRTGG